MTQHFSKPFLLLLFTCSLVFSQLDSRGQDSSRLRISLLTCTPGDELYSLFGHSALRVIDSNSVTDLVYNYGTFNFDDEGFYLKFIRGKLLYYVSVADFRDFVYDYQATNRGISEQLLNFSAAEKIQVNHALIQNLKEENKYYQYDFFFDNCTTRLRDLIVKNKQPTPVLPAVEPAGKRFREAIHDYLDKGDQQWSKWGIDVLLGARTDRIMSASDQQFLPDNLMKALDSSTNVRMVIATQDLYNIPALRKGKSFFTPMFFFISLLCFFVLLHLVLRKKLPVTLGGMDGLLFFLTGALGILLIFMWVATDHSMTKDNYNLLWAWPTHLVISFFIHSRKSWVRYYFLLSASGCLIVLGAWAFIPQQLNVALIPFVILLLFRSVARVIENKTHAASVAL